MKDPPESRKRRWTLWLWLALPALATILFTFFQGDEFAFLEQGGADVLTIDPDIESRYSLQSEEPARRSRGWVYQESADLLYLRVRARLTEKRGWSEMPYSFSGPIHPLPPSREFVNRDTGTTVVVQRDFYYGDLYPCAVFVQERTGLKAAIDRLQVLGRRLLSP